MCHLYACIYILQLLPKNANWRILNPAMRSYPSRLQRTYQKRTRQRIIIFLAASVIIVIALFKVGLPALFDLSGLISGARRSTNSIIQGPKFIPTKPVFSQDLVATSSANISISGAADPKITVETSQNGRVLGTVVAKDDGSFSYDVSLERGDNTFVAQAFSESGQKSLQSDPYVIKYLAGQPKLEVTSPKDGDKISADQVTVVGKTDSGNSVTVNDRYTIVNGEGLFSYTLNLNSGENKIKVVATDPAGNQTTKELTVTRQ